MIGLNLRPPLWPGGHGRSHEGLLGIPTVLFANECPVLQVGCSRWVTVGYNGPHPGFAKYKLGLKLYHAFANCVINFLICQMGIIKQRSLTYTFNMWEIIQCTQKKIKQLKTIQPLQYPHRHMKIFIQ